VAVTRKDFYFIFIFIFFILTSSHTTLVLAPRRNAGHDWGTLDLKLKLKRRQFNIQGGGLVIVKDVVGQSRDQGSRRAGSMY
jgi:hypothetical protein